MNYNPTESPSYSPQPGTDIPPMAKAKFSGPGIASFIVSLLALIGYISSIVLITAAFVDIMGQSIMPTPDDIMQRADAMSGVFLFLASLFLNLVGLVLAIVGLALKNRRKVFAILGLIFALLPGLGFIGLLVTGSMASL
ncbi:hypothetical protein [Paenibacillus senegalimassiliensis]|uniref:hypothetical protein n=1 Tax=Paenibacillus senegalimassiliensis TaxID=1737426 RepID=UPI00073E8FF9|nr:hypothetical protein [Paenibacillus senegalimassiliensis]